MFWLLRFTEPGTKALPTQARSVQITRIGATFDASAALQDIEKTLGGKDQGERLPPSAGANMELCVNGKPLLSCALWCLPSLAALAPFARFGWRSEGLTVQAGGRITVTLDGLVFTPVTIQIEAV